MIRFFSIIIALFNIVLLGNDKEVEIENNFQSPCERLYPEADIISNYRITIPKLNTLRINRDCIIVEGFISNIYRCPPCPEGVTCEPCASPRFYINTGKEENINKSTGRSYSISETMIHARKTCNLQLNKKYIFTIERKGTEGSTKDGKRITVFYNDLKGYSLIE